MPHPAREPAHRPLLVAAVLGALIVVPFLLRLELLQRRVFGNDELEHLHFAWSVSQGEVPYHDYFQVRREDLRRGFNDVLLRYPGAGREKRPELAVATIALQRVGAAPRADAVDSRPSPPKEMR